MIWGIVFVIFAADRLTKIWAVAHLSLYQSIPVVKNIFYITLVHNRGAAFGILKNQVPLFIAASVCAVVMIVYHLKKDAVRSRKPSLYTFSLGLILAGAAGNLVDRVFLGYVVDFLDFRVWPVFNVADSAITAGAVLLGVAMLKEELKDKKAARD
ncbi:MAG: signal peptidase II [Candidatus Omnitrophica bacterium]|nr:signal peptidase II [Candidatus Omnitrophota bacterium]